MKREWRWSKANIPYAERTPRFPDKTPQMTKTESYIQEEKKDNIMLRRNKRDETAERLSQRQFISQTSRNPFLEILNQCEDDSHMTMYIQDLNVQNEYLRPQDSNYRKT